MTNEHQSRQSSASALLRGHFTDGHTHFAVHASTAKDTDAFHVSVSDNPADIVLIVSGLITKQLHATWAESWRIFAPDWKLWVHDAAFQVFYTGHFTAAPTSSGTAITAYSNGDLPGKVRFCNG
jgi:hypothetical protein